MNSGNWAEAKNLLAVRLDSLGDVLMTTPAIRALKDSLPGRKVTLLTSPSGGQVAPYIPELDAVIEYDAPWMKATKTRSDSRAEHAFAAKLKQLGFDGAVIFTVYSQSPFPSAFMAYLADIPLRLAHCRENPYQLLTNWIPETGHEDNGRHEVQRQLDLVASIGAVTDNPRLSFGVPNGASRKVARWLRKTGLDQHSWVVIHPGATAASRRYPPEMYAVVAEKLAGQLGIQVVFTGTRSERDLVESIRGQMTAPSHSLVGQLDLAQMAALLEFVPLLVSNNTGPVHIAAALGTPVVVLYALTNPQHTPWNVPSRVLYHDVPCKFCYKSVCPQGHHDCLRRVEPETVVQSVQELLAETAELTMERRSSYEQPA